MAFFPRFRDDRYMRDARVFFFFFSSRDLSGGVPSIRLRLVREFAFLYGANKDTQRSAAGRRTGHRSTTARARLLESSPVTRLPESAEARERARGNACRNACIRIYASRRCVKMAEAERDKEAAGGKGRHARSIYRHSERVTI